MNNELESNMKAHIRENLKKIIPAVVLIVLIGAALVYLKSVSAGNQGLTASGSIEAPEIKLASELGGMVAEVNVQEGDQVEAGQVLVRFDDALLQAQLLQAEAALEQAQASYDLLVSGGPEAKRQAAIAAAQLQLTVAQQTLDDLLENTDLAAAQAEQAVANARDAVRDAQERVDNLYGGSPQVDIDQAEANLVLARDQLEQAQEDFEPYENKPETNLARATYQSRLAQAQKNYDNVVRYLNNLEGEANDIDLAQALADLDYAQNLLEQANRDYEERKNGPDPDALAQVQAQVENAQAQLTLAQADPSPEEVAVVAAQVEAAEAAVQGIEVQLDKLVLSAPVDGTILFRSIDPGEVAQPGTPLITLAQLDQLTITVYVQEDRYGTISIGTQALVEVDSYPKDQFNAEVVRIADQAEFTPRNVQTEEGRRATVYAIKLDVENLDGKLKPGMPADVTFNLE
jgi:multidrug resistance efflux pump